MPTGFNATELSVFEEHDALVTALGASPGEGDGPYLMFQRRRIYDEEDIKLGMDKPYVEYCEQSWSWYGHILHARLHRQRILVQMDSAAAARMNNDGLIEVTFTLTAEQLETLRNALHVTFKDYASFADEA
jgi:hypothetical protein